MKLGLKHCILLATLTASAAAQAIVGGQELTATHPMIRQVVVLHNAVNNSLCSGVILNAQVVLTAAHCVPTVPGMLSVIFAPTLRQGHLLNTRRAVRIEVAPRVQPTVPSSGADLALVKLNAVAPSGFDVLPLWPQSDLSLQRPGKMLLIAGYGVNDATSDDSKGRLRTTTLRLMDPLLSRFTARLDQRVGQGACRGDSGGPVIGFIQGAPHVWAVIKGGVDDPKNDCSQSSAVTVLGAAQPWLSNTLKMLTDPHP